jgi:hypothetical protein
MPFRNRNLAKRIKSNPCEWCGWQVVSRFASHIVDEGPEKDWNALSLCPNGATVFDEVIRPRLYTALKNYGVTNIPKSWSKSNKITNVEAAEPE